MPSNEHLSGEERVHEAFMQEALELASQALDRSELPIASILVLDNEIIASAHTSERADKRFLVHAEIKTLIEADAQGLTLAERRACQLYTTLEPCMMCLGACMSFFLGRIHFALESPGDGAIDMARSWTRREEDIPGYRLPDITRGVFRADVIELFERYVRNSKPGPMQEWAQSLAKL